MVVARWLVCSLGALALLGGTPAHAQEPAVLWYRSAEGCPDPDAFMRLLGAEASLVRLARAGDHIDFVVTFIAGAGSVSGRLERQTDAGTVAVREIDDTACDSVAGVLALGLQLALRGSEGSSTEPQASGTDSAVEAAEIAADSTADVVATSTGIGPGAPPNPAAPASTVAADGPAAPEIARAQRDPRRIAWSLEWLGGMTTEQIARPAVLSGVLLDAQRIRGGGLRAAARIGLLGSFAVRSTAEGPIDHGVLAARIDGCPLLLGTSAVELWPCLGAEIGAVRARGARVDGLAAGRVWAAVGGDLSLHWRLTPGFRVATGGGLVVPLSRYSLTAGDRELYATARAGERLWAGALFSLP